MAGEMWKALWQKWMIDKPAAFGDLLWDVLVVQFAAFLDKITLRRFIALIPVVLVIWATVHRIPVPPELMLVGDALAYIDVLSVLFLVSVLSRASTILFMARQAMARVAWLTNHVVAGVQRLDFRHRRDRRIGHRKRLFGRAKEDDEPAVAYGLAWASPLAV
jgi:hypothetical protein